MSSAGSRTKPIERPRWNGLHRRLGWRQKAELAALVGYSPHEPQKCIHESTARFRVVCCGRRFGKTTLAAFEALCVALMGGWVMIVAPTYALAYLVFREVHGLAHRGDMGQMVAYSRESQGRQEIGFRTGGRVFVRSSDNPTSLVGEGLDLVIFEETASEPDPEVWPQFLRPALLDRGGGALFISTPRGDDWFKDLWDRGDARDRGYASWRYPSEANPHLDQSLIEEDRRDLDADTFRQEYLAEFLDAAGAVFKGYRKSATSVWRDGPDEGLLANPGLDVFQRPVRAYAMGVDIAQFHDWTVCAIIDTTTREIVHLARFNMLGYPEQASEILRLSEAWCAPILIDATNNYSFFEQLRDACWWSRVEPFVFTSQSKSALMNDMKVDLEQETLRLLAAEQEGEEAQRLSKIALSEIGSYRYDRTAAGTLRMNAPEGKHDDCVVAIALANRLTRFGSGSPIVVQSKPQARRFGRG